MKSGPKFLVQSPELRLPAGQSSRLKSEYQDRRQVNLAGYCLNPEIFTVVGGLAGGNLDSLIVVIYGVTEFEDSDQGNTDESSFIQTRAGIFGPTTFPEMGGPLDSPGSGLLDLIQYQRNLHISALLFPTSIPIGLGKPAGTL